MNKLIILFFVTILMLNNYGCSPAGVLASGGATTMVMAEGLGRQLSPETDMWVMARQLVIEWLSSSEIKLKQFDEIVNDIKFARKRLPEILNKIDTFYEAQSTLNKNKSPITIILLSLLFVILICFVIFT